MIIDTQGLRLCSRYSFGPNSLHYCGPDRQKDLLGYVAHNGSDQGLAEILDRFETLYPYLILIASQNKIKDPFDKRVVEAYWLGNNLLSNIKTNAFAAHLSDGLELKRKIPRKSFIPLMDRAVDGGMPQHTFHVLNIFIRTGRLSSFTSAFPTAYISISWLPQHAGSVRRTQCLMRIILQIRPFPNR